MADSSGFKVPFGLNPDGTITQVAKAVRGLTYRCPQCLAPLTLRAGEIKAKHFSHRGGGSCSYESVLHHAAKHKLREVVQAWLDGWGKVPVIVIPCEGQRFNFCTSEIYRPLLRDLVDAVRLEANIGNFRPDVVLFLVDKAVLGLEVLVSHEVDEAKAEGSTHTWLELEAVAILESPHTWRPVQHNLKKESRCEFCKEANFLGLDRTISRLEEQAEAWVAKAKNPDSAKRSLFWEDNWLNQKIRTKIREEQDLAVTRWYKAHSEPAPIPAREEEGQREDYPEISLRESLNMLTRGIHFN